MQYEIIAIDNTKPITYYRLKSGAGVLKFVTRSDMRQMIIDGDNIIGAIIKDGVLSIPESVTYTMENKLINPDTIKGYIAVYSGESLKSFVETSEAIGLRERDICNDMYKFINTSGLRDTVCILHGIRRTGKTVALIHVILRLLKDGVKPHSICYMLVASGNKNSTMNDIYEYLWKHRELKYIFLDEVSFIKDFEANSSLLANDFALTRKIILTGTDSYIFPLARKTSLFGRTEVIHSTYMSYKEYYRLMGFNEAETALSEYLRFGGVLKRSEYSGARNLYITLQAAVIYNVIYSIENCGHKRTVGINLEPSEMTYLLYTAILMAVSPKDTKDIYNYNKKIKGDAAKMIANITGMDESDIISINRSLIDNRSRYKFIEVLDELDIIEGIPNLILPGDTVAAITQHELICNIQGIVYTTLQNTIKNKSLLVGTTFENMVASNVVMWGRANGDRYKVGYIKYKAENVEHEIDVAVQNMDTGATALIEVKYSEQFKSEFIKHLLHDSLSKIESINPARKIIVYRGNTIKYGDIQCVNAHDFLMNLDTYLKI